MNQWTTSNPNSRRVVPCMHRISACSRRMDSRELRRTLWFVTITRCFRGRRSQQMRDRQRG